jgi:hypothetical protein
MNQIDRIDHILKSYTTLPTDICNIIAHYATDCIMQVYVDKKIYYKYNNKLYFVMCGDTTLGVVYGVVYKFTAKMINHIQMLSVSIADSSLLDDYIRLPNDDRIYHIKYSNGLICEYLNKIVIYNTTISDSNTVVLKERCSLSIDNSLLYADDQYIIVHDRHNIGITIYDTNLIKFAFIKTSDYVRYVALVDDVLSYYTDGWHVLTF